MRISELVETVPDSPGFVYICHAPDGQCRVLARDGTVFDRPDVDDPHNIAPAVGMLFDSHWRGANAHEIASYVWPRTMPGQGALFTTGSFDAEIRREARMVEAGGGLTRADAEADIAGTPRPDNPTTEEGLRLKSLRQYGHTTSLHAPLGSGS